MQHRVEPGLELLRVHSAEEDGHEKSRQLLVGDTAAGRAPDEVLQLVGAQRAAVALLADEIVSAHAECRQSYAGSRVKRLSRTTSATSIL